MLSRLLPVVTVPFFKSSSGGFIQMILRQREERVDKSCGLSQEAQAPVSTECVAAGGMFTHPPHVVVRSPWSIRPRQQHRIGRQEESYQVAS